MLKCKSNSKAIKQYMKEPYKSKKAYALVVKDDNLPLFYLTLLKLKHESAEILSLFIFNVNGLLFLNFPT